MRDDRRNNETDSSLIELRDLLADFMNGELTEEQNTQLQQLAIKSDAARQLYIDYMCMYGSMYRKHRNREKAQGSLLPPFVDNAEEPQNTPTNPNSSIFPLLEIEDSLLSSCSDTDAFGGSTKSNPNAGNPGNFFGRINFSFLPGLTMIIMSTLLLSALVILPIYWSTRSADKWTIVARINQMSDCVWQEGCEQFRPGDFLINDQMLNLERGVVELQFYSGAKTILQGPAKFSPTTKNAGQLGFGRLAATVPEGAEGFMIKTPALDVVDLGTEFGLFVDTESNSDVHVFKGEVAVKTETAPGKNDETKLTGDQALHFDLQTGKFEDRPSNPNRFICDMAPLDQPLEYTIENDTLLPGGKDFCFFQSRAALLPHKEGELPELIIVTQQQNKQAKDRGQHGYRDLFQVKSNNLGFSWSKLRIIPSLKRGVINGQGSERTVGDFCPKLHRRSGVVLGTGRTFSFVQDDIDTEKSKLENQVSYSVYDADSDRWSEPNVLALPERDHAGTEITEPSAADAQRVDLPDGDILLPMQYRKGNATERAYTSIVARCGFDGRKLTYKEHGSEMTISQGEGLLCPSLTSFKEHYYLTFRSEHNGYLTRGTDGINFEPVREWTFDDGVPLKSLDTQQHWVTHSDGLFLVYTRKGANNGHISGFRAPLFIAQVDPERLCLIRSTERILIPENNASLGNFGVVNITPLETWITAAEYPRNGRSMESARTIIAKLYWSKPNMAMQP